MTIEVLLPAFVTLITACCVSEGVSGHSLACRQAGAFGISIRQFLASIVNLEFCNS